MTTTTYNYTIATDFDTAILFTNIQHSTIIHTTLYSIILNDTQTSIEIYFGNTLTATEETELINLVNNNIENPTNYYQAIMIGYNAGQLNQNVNGIAMGNLAGQINQKNSISIGFQAGQSGQNSSAVAIGNNAGQYQQGQNSVHIGYQAGQVPGPFFHQSSVGIGYQSGNYLQESYSTAVGFQSGQSGQKGYSVALGYQAGNYNIGTGSISIGYNSGQTNQGENSIAIGYQAGSNIQGTGAISIGYQAGQTNQSNNSMAIGYFAGNYLQGTDAIAIGYQAGQTNQGTKSIAIGYNANVTGQNNIFLNATGVGLTNFANTGAFYVAPIRNMNNSTYSNCTALQYDPSSNEIMYSNTSQAVSSSILSLSGYTGGNFFPATTYGLTAGYQSFTGALNNSALTFKCPQFNRRVILNAIIDMNFGGPGTNNTISSTHFEFKLNNGGITGTIIDTHDFTNYVATTTNCKNQIIMQSPFGLTGNTGTYTIFVGGSTASPGTSVAGQSVTRITTYVTM